MVVNKKSALSLPSAHSPTPPPRQYRLAVTDD